MANTITPQLSTVVRSGYLADTAAYSVNVTYPGEDPRRVTFVGDALHNGPVTMVSGDVSTRVDRPERFGTFGPEWVRSFFAEVSA